MSRGKLALVFGIPALFAAAMGLTFWALEPGAWVTYVLGPPLVWLGMVAAILQRMHDRIPPTP